MVRCEVASVYELNEPAPIVLGATDAADEDAVSDEV